MYELSISAEALFEVYGFTVTNSLIATFVTTITLVLIAFYYHRNASIVPSGLQTIIEFPLNAIYSLSKQIAHTKARDFFPVVVTIFLFVLVSNWIALLPGVTAVSYYGDTDTHHSNISTAYAAEDTHEEEKGHGVHLFRAATADLNTTIALGIIAIFAVHYYGFKYLGIKDHLSKFINFSSPIDAFVGFLEIISEFVKIISFGFRLFGNIFAGEVLLLVMGMIIPSVLPKLFEGSQIFAGIIQFPFLGLEIFVGFIQALVFGMLTLVFCTVATQHH